MIMVFREYILFAFSTYKVQQSFNKASQLIRPYLVLYHFLQNQIVTFPLTEYISICSWLLFLKKIQSYFLPYL